MKGFLALVLLLLSSFVGAVRVHGTLVDAAGRPIPNAALFTTAYRLSPAPPGRKTPDRVRLRAKTDGRGMFSLEAPAHPDESTPMAMLVRLPNGRYGTAWLEGEGGRAVLRDRPSTLNLHVTDLGGKPIGNAKVHLSLWLGYEVIKPPLYFFAEAKESDWEGRTDAGGNLVFENLPDRIQINFKVRHPGYVGGDGLSTHVEATAPSEYNVVLGRPGGLSGRVLREGRPLGGVPVIVSGQEPGRFRTQVVRTDARGYYRVRNLYPSPVSVAVDLRATTGEWYALPHEEVQIEEGEERHGLDFSLQRKVPLRVHVLTERRGLPLANATVSISGPGRFHLERITDAGGRVFALVSQNGIPIGLDEGGGRRRVGFLLRTDLDAMDRRFEFRVPEDLIGSLGSIEF